MNKKENYEKKQRGLIEMAKTEKKGTQREATKARLQKLKLFSAALATTVATWIPVSSAKPNQSNPEHNPLPKTEVTSLTYTNNPVEEGDLLALASPNDERGYSGRILEISVKTEVYPGSNPAATATGNGYYGQHQFGSTAGSDFAVKKYLAYAMINSSPAFRNAIAKNLMTGTQAQKDRLIDNFEASTQKYADKNQIEKAYYNTNKAYASLAASMRVTPSAFTKAMNASPKEAQDTQGMFIYEIYIYQMNNNFGDMQKKHSRVDFSRIHPAVLGSAIAIAVKTGNGKKFNTALSILDRDLEKGDKEALSFTQKKIDATWKRSLEADVKNGKITAEEAAVLEQYKTEAIVDRSGRLNEKDIRISGNQITVYDPSGNLEKDMILAGTGKVVSIVKAHAPKLDDTKMHKPVQIVDRCKAKPDYSLINNKTWLKNYCGEKFAKVYKEAAPLIDKLPTMATIYELSVILRMPGLYKMYQTIEAPNRSQDRTLALHTPDEKTVQEKIIQLRETKHMTMLKENLTLLSANELAAFSNNRNPEMKPTVLDLAIKKKREVLKA